MRKEPRTAARPDWNGLYGIAAAQDGHFTTAQAATAGYYPQLLAKYLRNGRVTRIRRGVYRMVQFPPGEREDLTVAWLWTGQAGVFSHETALSLHGLSDALPSRVYITLPAAWRSRRLRVPKGIVLHFAGLGTPDRTWVGTVPATTAARTLLDCAAASVAPDLVRQAYEEAVGRGLVRQASLGDVAAYLAKYAPAKGPKSRLRSWSSSRPSIRRAP